MAYNATVYTTKKATGESWGTSVAEVENINGRLQMLRGNAVQCTGKEGKCLVEDVPELEAVAGDAIYDLYVRLVINPDLDYRIELDNCKGYKEALVS